ncbi:hypothetical protein CFB3_29420 [Clostridium folliculivorans]|uniref:Uncharacterized protein n=1 Tax=Clostridium folliculivorans TaxID=2886038 RepID=A0A9W6DAE0_9CLOT|nr:hypothetical protein CFOLD11_15630 [Clostridium folliculivorans]GKU30835.1 hypothetical protein CFB3_29420 [Clostridium folliculivorans]
MIDSIVFKLTNVDFSQFIIVLMNVPLHNYRVPLRKFNLYLFENRAPINFSMYKLIIEVGTL